jgi:hypothetical protein
MKVKKVGESCKKTVIMQGFPKNTYTSLKNENGQMKNVNGNGKCPSF